MLDEENVWFGILWLLDPPASLSQIKVPLWPHRPGGLYNLHEPAAT